MAISSASGNTRNGAISRQSTIDLDITTKCRSEHSWFKSQCCCCCLVVVCVLHGGQQYGETDETQNRLKGLGGEVGAKETTLRRARTHMAVQI